MRLIFAISLAGLLSASCSSGSFVSGEKSNKKNNTTAGSQNPDDVAVNESDGVSSQSVKDDGQPTVYLPESLQDEEDLVNVRESSTIATDTTAAYLVLEPIQSVEDTSTAAEISFSRPLEDGVLSQIQVELPLKRSLNEDEKARSGVFYRYENSNGKYFLGFKPASEITWVKNKALVRIKGPGIYQIGTNSSVVSTAKEMKIESAFSHYTLAYNFDGGDAVVEPHENGRFGRSVDVSGDWKIVGSPRFDSEKGAVYFYKKIDGAWVFKQGFTRDAASARFGISVAISGNYAFAGADRQANSQGRLFQFQYNSSTGDWVMDETPIEPPGSISADGLNMGHSLSMAGDLLAVGAPAYDADPAANIRARLLIYKKDVTGSFSGAPIIVDDGEVGTAFGNHVVTDGLTVFTGARTADGSRGRAYQYDANGNLLADFPNGQEATDAVDFSEFSDEIAFDGANLVIRDGASGGRVFSYRYNGTEWVYQSTLKHPQGDTSGGFGESVAIDKGFLAVSDPNGTNNSGKGMTYLYKLVNSSWRRYDRLRPDKLTSEDSFGHFAIIKGDYLYISADRYNAYGVNQAGAVFTYDLNILKALYDQKSG